MKKFLYFILILMLNVIIVSCQSQIEKEKYWFNVGFDTTYYYIIKFADIKQNHFSQEEYVKEAEQAVYNAIRNIINSLLEKAKNREEAEIFAKALYAGAQTIIFELANFASANPDVEDDILPLANYLRTNKETIRKNGWKNYLIYRKFRE